MTNLTVRTKNKFRENSADLYEQLNIEEKDSVESQSLFPNDFKWLHCYSSASLV